MWLEGQSEVELAAPVHQCDRSLQVERQTLIIRADAVDGSVGREERAQLRHQRGTRIDRSEKTGRPQNAGEGSIAARADRRGESETRAALQPGRAPSEHERYGDQHERCAYVEKVRCAG